MKTSFSKLKNICSGILFAGLAIIAIHACHSGTRVAAPQSNDRTDKDTDTGISVLTGFNFGFETVSNPDGLPDGWGRWGSPSYNFILDSEVKHSGKYSLRIESATENIAAGEFGCPRLSIPVTFAGATVTLKAFMKLVDVEKPIGLLLRIDGESGSLAFDNMQQKGITGTRDWQEYSVTVDFPENAKTIYIGAIHSGPGKLWVDDFQVVIRQTPDYNLDFETVSNPSGLPDGWQKWGMSSYNIQVDSEVKRKGKNSLRIEPKNQDAIEGFGCPARSIPAIYEGKKITLVASMRTEGVENPIGLMLRIDGSSGVLGFDNMQQRGIKGSKEWEDYSVSLPLPEEAKTIHIGAILSGKGKLWIDDIQLLIDDEDISKAKLKPKKTFKAEEDTEFNAGSKINIKTCTPQMAADLELLGRIWGFLKYFHPAVATGDYNWDAELFRIMPFVINAANTNERNKIFEEWIDRLGKPKAGKYEKRPDVKLQPDFVWLENPELGNNLPEKLKDIRDAARNAEEHYYIGLHPGVQNPNFKNEKPYAQMNYVDDSGMRLLALFRYWNMIEYFFPYKHLTDKNWNTVLGAFIPKFLDGTTELDYKQALLQLIAHVNDTHANIYNDRALDTWKGINTAPYHISFVEGKSVVTGISNSEPAQPSGLKKGDVITHIDGKPVEKMVEERQPYSPASNVPVQLRNIARDLLRTNADKLSLQILRDSKSQTLEVECIPFARAYTRSAPKASHRLLSPDVGYIWLETLKRDSVSAIMDKFKDTKGIIIDIRCYPTDFPIYELGAYLTPQPTDFVNFTRGSIEQPGTFSFTGTNKVGNNNDKCYKGKLVVIVNEQTQSSAEFHAMAFQTAPQAKVIGSTTSAADGNVSTIVLPGNVSTMITGIGVYYPDGRETQRIGIKLDMEVKPTIQGIIEGRDELLEKAMDMINF